MMSCIQWGFFSFSLFLLSLEGSSRHLGSEKASRILTGRTNTAGTAKQAPAECMPTAPKTTGIRGSVESFALVMPVFSAVALALHRRTEHSLGLRYSTVQ